MQTSHFVSIRKLEANERMGLIVIFNRGVSIRSAVASDPSLAQSLLRACKWRLTSNFGQEKCGASRTLRASGQEIVENLRLEIFSLEILIGFTREVNRGFAIRNLDGSGRLAPASC